MNFWQQLENSVGENFPPCVVELLKECGYNSSFAINALQAKDISEIENFIDENLKYIVDDMKCCNSHTYKNQKHFKFLPAHRSFILNLKNRSSLIKSVPEKCSSSIEQSSIKEFSALLQTLIRTAEQNANKVPTQFRYHEVIKYFAMYIHMVCGKMCYETLSSNLPLPQSSTVRKHYYTIKINYSVANILFIILIVHYINESKQRVIEGKLRCNELLEYLQNMNAPLIVWLSEDATGVVPKIEYDSTFNQLSGLVLPIDQSTGMPIPQSFLARSSEEIASNMNKPMSCHVYIVMAQPLKENVPPFLLLMYGTDNKFKSTDVLQRWKFIQKELKK